MANNKKSVPAKKAGKQATKPGKVAKREIPAKPPKKGKAKEPLNRNERKKAAWLRKTERKTAQQTTAEVGAKSEVGLTFDQLDNPDLAAVHTRQSKPTGPTFEQTLLEVVATETEIAESVHLPMDVLEPEIRIIFSSKEVFNNTTVEDIVEPIGDVATRNVVVAEIRSLLEKTRAVFGAFREPDILTAQLAAGETFERESESPLGLRLAEVIIADNPAETIEEFLEEVYDRTLELQIVASALDPESELEKSARLGLIDEATITRLQKATAEEAIRIDLSQRLTGLLTASTTPAEVDETFATLIAEAAQTAKAERNKRAAFRQTLRGRKEREGRRFSKSPNEPSDEEFLSFLVSHRGEAGVEQELLVRKKTVATDRANQIWSELAAHLAANTGNPEIAVAQNATAMRDFLDDLAQIRTLNERLTELDRASERGGGEEASWINQLNLLSKRRSRGPRGMRHMLQQVKPLQPGKETADKEDLVRFLGRRSKVKDTPFAATFKVALA